MNSPSRNSRQKDHDLGIRIASESLVKESYTIDGVNHDPERIPHISASKTEKCIFVVIHTVWNTMSTLPKQG